MEVQPPQSVQINFNNKIITLHNVTIVKNPKIITIDATQYSNFLKGSPVKLNNASSTTTPIKFQMPSLAPMKKSPVFQTGNLSFKTGSSVNSIVLNQKSVVAPMLGTSQVITRTLQPSNNFVRFKSSPNVVAPSAALIASVKAQAQTFLQQQQQQQQQQPTVIISPSKVSSNNISPVKVQLKQASTPAFVIAKSPSQANAVPTIVKTNSAQTIVKPASVPTVAKPASASTTVKTASVPTKVIISPPQKNKISPCIITPPDAKRQCQKFEYHCIFCKDSFDDSNVLVQHLKLKHADSMKVSKKEVEDVPEEVPEPVAEPVEPELLAEKKPASLTLVEHLQEIKKQLESEISEDEDDDESEVNDLIMDLEETQDTATSSQARSDTPESPEFEEHFPMVAIKMEIEDPVNESNFDLQEDFDYENYEYCSNMEPICELTYEDDSNDGVQDENEAMRLYREAMEVNYQQNGIKKRGRRKQQKPKPLVENTTSLNGILAGLLENSSIKVPPGPGRGRRKEINAQELELDRSNGVCLFSCNKCDESFKYAGDLAKHVRSHTISSPYQCSICQRKFTHIGSLNTHLRIHSGERPYKCNQCDKSFTQSNSLMVHVKSHLSNKPFQCLQCNKGFLNASSLALHTKTHTGPTTVTCPIDSCGKEFRDNNLLEEHMMTHRQSMLYQCSLCSEKFEQSCLLVQHVKSHIGDKPFQCNQCGKCFTQPGSLNTHLRIHTGEKPFECSICGKKFTQASSLSVHMKVHGEKEFKCSIESCSKSYSQEAYLKKHMLKHIESSLNDENNHIAQE